VQSDPREGNAPACVWFARDRKQEKGIIRGASDTSVICSVCAVLINYQKSKNKMRRDAVGERGLGLVVHIPAGCVAKINIP
jgi:hypothetical protein